MIVSLSYASYAVWNVSTFSTHKSIDICYDFNLCDTEVDAGQGFTL